MLERIESFPFDSAYVGVDNFGYPIFDRAVGAAMLRDVCGKFFSDGVFQTDPSSLYISKGAGMNITVSPGLAIIKGGIGGFRGTRVYTLEQAAGRVAYGVFIRVDDNEESRSLFVRVDHGEAGDNPLPPEPISTAAIREYRLGYVVVPANATDLSEAIVYNEQGLEVCPYAAPFVDIDVSQVIKDVKDASQAQYDIFVKYLNDNRELIDSALDGTVLQTIINQIENCVKKDTLDPRNLEYDSYGKLGLASGAVDNDTLEFNDNRAVKVSAAFVKKVDDVVSEALTPKPGKDLGAYTWEEIFQLAIDAAKNPSEYAYLVGSSKPVEFSGYGRVDMQIIGVAHDDLSDGSGKAGFTFMSEQILLNHQMNTSNTTVGGWASTEMRRFMSNSLFPSLPQVFRDNIKEVNKAYKHYNSSNGFSLKNIDDYLFLASEIEVFGTNSTATEGSQYQYWSENNNNNARIKKLNGSADYWWLRSVYSSTYFCIVNNSGSLHSSNASYSDGVVPCFCI